MDDAVEQLIKTEHLFQNPNQEGSSGGHPDLETEGMR